MRGIATEVVIDAPISFVQDQIDERVHRLRMARFLTGAIESTDHRFHHDGIVAGAGELRLTASGAATIIAIVDRISAPWYLGGSVATSMAAPMLTANWQRNLASCKTAIEREWARSRRAESADR